MAVIGLDLGGTKLAAALFSDGGDIVHRSQRALEGRSGDDVGRLITDQVTELTSHAREQGHSIRAVGVSVPGIYRDRDGTVWAPNIPGWDRYPLRSLIQEHAGQEGRVAIDNDRACSILGEAGRGVAQGCDDAIFLAVGTGIGAGILTGGRVLRGADDIAGAIGWMALDRPYHGMYDRRGCFETHASGAGIEEKARKMLAVRPRHDGPLRQIDPSKLTAHDVFAAFEQGDAVAVALIENAIECWGMAVANLVSLFNPQVIAFGGGIFGPAVRLLDRIEAEARRWAQPISIGQVVLRASALGPDACLFGTGQLALSAAESHR
jgi:glucokinase